MLKFTRCRGVGRVTLAINTSGGINIVARLIESQADVNAQNAAGMRPLHYGALFGHVSILKKLAEHGADIDAQDADGNTALHLAAQMGFESAVQFLKS